MSSRAGGSLRQAGRVLLTAVHEAKNSSSTSSISSRLWFYSNVGTRKSAAMTPCGVVNSSCVKSLSVNARAHCIDMLRSQFRQERQHGFSACTRMHLRALDRTRQANNAAAPVLLRNKTPLSSSRHVFQRPVTHAASVEESIELPTWKQLRALALQGAVPMIGFGIMDQTIMIQAGDFIDSTIGQNFALPTLAAAACGQVFSDFSGVLFGSTVEAMAGRMGLPVHGLSGEQIALPIARKWHTIGAAIGVVFGCLIGMTQILFMDLKRDQRLQEFSQLKTVFAEIMTHDATALHADRLALYLVDQEAEKLWTVSQSTGVGSVNIYVEMSWNKGISGASARTGQLLNIPDAYECPYFNKEYDMKNSDRSGHFRTQSVLAVPVANRSDGKVFAVLQFINKRDTSNAVVPFNDEDVDAGLEMAKMLGILRPTLQMMMTAG